MEKTIKMTRRGGAVNITNDQETRTEGEAADILLECKGMTWEEAMKLAEAAPAMRRALENILALESEGAAAARIYARAGLAGLP